MRVSFQTTRPTGSGTRRRPDADEDNVAPSPQRRQPAIVSAGRRSRGAQPEGVPSASRPPPWQPLARPATTARRAGCGSETRDVGAARPVRRGRRRGRSRRRRGTRTRFAGAPTREADRVLADRQRLDQGAALEGVRSSGSGQALAAGATMATAKPPGASGSSRRRGGSGAEVGGRGRRSARTVPAGRRSGSIGDGLGRCSRSSTPAPSSSTHADRLVAHHQHLSRGEHLVAAFVPGGCSRRGPTADARPSRSAPGPPPAWHEASTTSMKPLAARPW